MWSLSMSVCVCVCEDHHCGGGGGRLRFKPWNRLTGAFLCGVLAVFVLHGIKTSLLGNTQGIVTYTKTPSRTTLSPPLSTHTSVSPMHLLKVRTVIRTLTSVTKSTSTINS